MRPHGIKPSVIRFATVEAVTVHCRWVRTAARMKEIRV